MTQSRTLYTSVITLAILLRTASAVANTNTAIKSGAWETGSNWSTGVAPLATDDVVVPAGFTMNASVAGDVCGTLTINATGTVFVSSSFTIGGNLTNAGTLQTFAGSSITFNGAATSVISGGGSYTIAGTVAMNMGSAATALDVKDVNFIGGINSGGKYYFSFIRGTWKMDNTATLADAYNSGSSTALTIPYGVVIEADAGQMNIGKKAKTDSIVLSGKLFINGGNVFVQLGQSTNAGYDFRYTVNGGTPQLYVASGNLYVGAGFNALNNSDYIDFNMTGGTIVLAQSGYSNWITFQLADNVGGKTFMSGGTIVLQDACNANIEDLDMGGANVAATLYSVTGGTVQLGYVNTQAGSTYFGINAEPTTNYPNIDFEAGVAKNVSAFKTGNINMLSLYVNANMTFDATGFPIVNIMASNGTFAFDEEGGFKEATNTVEFSGSVPQLIKSSTLASETFYNLQISNTSGNVILGLPTTVSNQLSFTSGMLDASGYPLTISKGSVAVTGASSSSYVIVGDGVTKTGSLKILSLPTNTSTFFPIGTSAYYLPASLNPGANSGSAYTAYVFSGATQNAQSNGTPMTAATLANMLSAVWNISRTAGSGSTSLTLYWSPSAVPLQGSTFSIAGTNIGIAQYTGAGGWMMGSGSGSVPGQTATSSFSSFTQFSIVDNLFVLPVTISNFTAVLQGKHSSLLSWTESEDISISDFVVERSTDGATFTPIGTVQAGVAQSDYSYIDASPSSGVNYYRLLINQTDGSSMYSPIRTVSLSSLGGITVYPIPATTTVNVSLGNAGTGVSVRLISQTGQIMRTAFASGGSQVVPMDISNFPAGVYFVQIIGDNQVLQTTTVSKL